MCKPRGLDLFCNKVQNISGDILQRDQSLLYNWMSLSCASIIELAPHMDTFTMARNDWLVVM